MNRLARQLTESRAFRGLVIGVIAAAGTLAGLETSAAFMARHATWVRTLDTLILGFFVAEIVLKLVAHSPRPLAFFRDGWNVFDVTVVALCLLPAAGPFASVLRLARVLRLLRLVSALPKLQLLVSALLRSLSAMGYVSLLLLLLFYMYAVAGVHLFGRANPADFGTLPATLLTLFRVVTLDNWGDFFHRAAAGTSPLVVTAYFVTFIVFGTMIILNLFIGIIMNSMAEAHAEQIARTTPDKPRPTTESLDAALRQLEELRRTLHDLRRAAEARPSPPVSFEVPPCPPNSLSPHRPPLRELSLTEAG